MDILNHKIFAPSIAEKIKPGLTVIPTMLILTSILPINDAKAGAFIYAGSTNGIDLIAHPPRYTGAGGQLDVKVCIDPGSINASKMEQPVKNAIHVWNKQQPTTSNLLNHLPGGSGYIGFESVLLHELGHGLGLAHSNIGKALGVQEKNESHTQSTSGSDYEYDFDPGADGIIGSADDIRGNDINLHWFRKDNNNPFSIAQTIDFNSYARDTSFLPNGDLFAVNGNRTVSELFNAAHSEAVMHQGGAPGEIQRTLLHDDIATLRLAMDGLDETSSTEDDYTINLISGGISNNCDINISFNNRKAGGVARTIVRNPVLLNSSHVELTGANIYFNDSINWYFTDSPQCSQSTVLKSNKWRMISMPCQLGISTPNTVEAVFGDDLDVNSYETRWVLYEYLPASGYRKLELSDPLKEGVGYWITTLDADASVDVLGEYNSNIDIPLGDGTDGGKWNLVGTPFRFDTTWADVQIIDNHGDVLSLTQTDPLVGNDRACNSSSSNSSCIVASTAFRWNGTSQTYEKLTLSSGVLSAFDGIWVYSKKAGVALRVPMSSTERSTQ